MSDDIIFTELNGVDGKLGQITLNRPKALNALTFTMCRELYHQLQSWQHDSNIHAVLIKSVPGRAFCAGGDIRALFAKEAKQHAPKFFQQEYAMNQLLYHFPKPYISLLDGIVMGGGAGISLHGSHPVVTERLMFAMPETGIGFFPDVGASEFLCRIPHRVGFYLALTGNIIGAHDAHDFGLCQFVVPSSHLADLEKALLEQPIHDHKAVSQVIDQFHLMPAESDIAEDMEPLEMAFKEATMEKIIFFLQQVGSEWASNTANMLMGRSPTSLKVTLELLNRAANMTSFDERIAMDAVVAQHFLQSHDFQEGVRAIVIDKDQRPRWQPAKLADVTDEQVQAFFNPPMNAQ